MQGVAALAEGRPHVAFAGVHGLLEDGASLGCDLFELFTAAFLPPRVSVTGALPHSLCPMSVIVMASSSMRGGAWFDVLAHIGKALKRFPRVLRGVGATSIVNERLNCWITICCHC